jgi:hypothetical protein
MALGSYFYFQATGLNGSTNPLRPNESPTILPQSQNSTTSATPNHCHPEERSDETSALKIGREMLNFSAVILSAVKDPQLHFHGLGWNAIPCPTAVASFQSELGITSELPTNRPEPCQ